MIVKIDRSPFPSKFFGDGFRTYRHNNLSLSINEVDLEGISLVTMLEGNEEVISGYERNRRFEKTNFIPLNAMFFQTFWNKKQIIPEIWKNKTGNETTHIYFDGTEFRHGVHNLCVPSIFWNSEIEKWFWRLHWLKDSFGKNHLSAVIGSQNKVITNPSEAPYSDLDS
jgi:hypothetical protein